MQRDDIGFLLRAKLGTLEFRSVDEALYFVRAFRDGDEILYEVQLCFATTERTVLYQKRYKTFSAVLDAHPLAIERFSFYYEAEYEQLHGLDKRLLCDVCRHDYFIFTLHTTRDAIVHIECPACAESKSTIYWVQFPRWIRTYYPDLAVERTE